MDEVKSSCVVPRARWSLGDIVGASASGLPLAASAHEHGRFAVDDSQRGLADCHCSILLMTSCEQRRGRSRVTVRMVVDLGTPNGLPLRLLPIPPLLPHRFAKQRVTRSLQSTTSDLNKKKILSALVSH